MLTSLKSHESMAPEATIEVLATYLVERGQLDPASLERGRRTAAESGNRLDRVLTQLGLVSELALAEGLAAVMALRFSANAPKGASTKVAMPARVMVLETGMPPSGASGP